MSMASKVLCCNKCNQSANTCMLHQNFQYIFNDTDVKMSTNLGYCHDCDRLSVVEDFDNLDYDIKQIQSCSKEAIRKARRPLSISFTKGMKSWNAAYVEDLASHAYLLSIAIKRKGDERCLTCLGRNITKFDGDMSIEYGIAGYYEGRKSTGFKHPGCEGEFIVSGSDIRYILSREPVYFNVSDDWQISELED